MPLRLTPSQVDSMFAHARAAAPEECCGLLVGRREGDVSIAVEVIPSANAWEGDRRTRFLLDPLTHLRAQRTARDRGLDIVGFYHSHPTSPPIPSVFDREMAWPGHDYVILSLLEPPTLRNWRLPGDETVPGCPERDRQFREEPLHII